MSFIDTFAQHVSVMVKLLDIQKLNAKIRPKKVLKKTIKDGYPTLGHSGSFHKAVFHTKANRQKSKILAHKKSSFILV